MRQPRRKQAKLASHVAETRKDSAEVQTELNQHLPLKRRETSRTRKNEPLEILDADT